MPYDNSGDAPLRIPGFSMPIDAKSEEHSLRRIDHVLDKPYFAEGIEGWSGHRMTVRELAMLRLTESITDKPDWDQKVFDDAIVVKWRAEALAMPLISEAAWEWVITEVRDKAKAFDSSRMVLALDSNARCVKSDVLVGPDLRAELIAHVRPLLSVPDEQKDFHPGSNDQVLNLVHPSLFPLVYGKTRVLAQGGRVGLAELFALSGKDEVAPAQDLPSDSNTFSTNFQWLPCEVEFMGGPEDTGVRITSYINNLHPGKHRSLYGTIEKLISLSVPLWNGVVMMRNTPRTELRIKIDGADWAPPLPDWAQYHSTPVKTTDAKFDKVMQKVRDYLELPNRPGYTPDEDEDGDYDPEDFSLGNEQDPDIAIAWLKEKLQQIEGDKNARDWESSVAVSNVIERTWKRLRYVLHPEPDQSPTYEDWKAGKPANNYRVNPELISLREWFKDQGLQVIVKLASIELTPDKPRYSGGSWHVEGMKNEHIVATSIYYYDVENTTPSHLSFRQGAEIDELDLRYEQDDHEPLATVFGTESMRDEPAIQEIGRIATPEGRILAFPNTLQHAVEPFELVDKTKPGHRRFLVLWLVDPHYRVVSTRNVVPQQHSWWAEEALTAVDFGTLPQEVVDMVKGEIGDWPMGLDEAKAYRLKLMAERTRATEAAVNRHDYYNLCEH